ncbi:hypothetical protein TcG_11186 [Trypanosoma cruzi]|nr:hypothetical protein TcG_11186 [Trypanosoma cruzi]
MTVEATVHIFLIHQLLPLRVLTQTIPTGLLIQVILQRHQVIKQTLTCALVHHRRHRDTAPINDDPHRVAAAVGAPNSNPARRGIAWQALKKGPSKPMADVASVLVANAGHTVVHGVKSRHNT